MKRLALFSLNDTTYAEQFAGQLIDLGWEIVASRETVDILRKRGLPVVDIADFTGVEDVYGFPPTLHAKVEYALTGNSRTRIDLVYIDPYPIATGNDVGGRTLLALAVKGGRIAVMTAEDMSLVVSEIARTAEVPNSIKQELADKACFEIAQHYSSLIVDRNKHDFIMGQHCYDLLNGENPYQVPASLFKGNTDNDLLSLPLFTQVAGEPPCYTNMADADCVLRTLCLSAEAFKINWGTVPYICIAAKHGNACGVGTSRKTAAESIEQALFGNPRSIWGGELITNFHIDAEMAELLLKSKHREKLLGDGSWMLDLIMAPSFTQDAISILGKRKRRKLFVNKALASPVLKAWGHEYRPVRGGFLRQPVAGYVLNIQECELEGHCLDEAEVASLIVAWAVAFSSNHGGNEIALAKNGVLLGVGGGPSTVEAVQVAIERVSACGRDVIGAAFAADAFFPFTDGPTKLRDAGATIGCIPAGGKNEGEIRNLFRNSGMTIAYLPESCRGFCRH